MEENQTIYEKKIPLKRKMYRVLKYITETLLIGMEEFGNAMPKPIRITTDEIMDLFVRQDIDKKSFNKNYKP